MIVSNTAAISVEPVAPVPLGTVGSSPNGSENWAKTSVPPTRGCSVVVTLADVPGATVASEELSPLSPQPAATSTTTALTRTTERPNRSMTTPLLSQGPPQATRDRIYYSVGSRRKCLPRDDDSRPRQEDDG